MENLAFELSWDASQTRIDAVAMKPNKGNPIVVMDICATNSNEGKVVDTWNLTSSIDDDLINPKYSMFNGTFEQALDHARIVLVVALNKMSEREADS